MQRFFFYTVFSLTLLCSTPSISGENASDSDERGNIFDFPDENEKLGEKAQSYIRKYDLQIGEILSDYTRAENKISAQYQPALDKAYETHLNEVKEIDADGKTEYLAILRGNPPRISTAAVESPIMGIKIDSQDAALATTVKNFRDRATKLYASYMRKRGDLETSYRRRLDKAHEQIVAKLKRLPDKASRQFAESLERPELVGLTAKDANGSIELDEKQRPNQKDELQAVDSAFDLLSRLPEDFKWDKETLKWSEPRKSSATIWAKEHFAGLAFDLEDAILTGSTVSKNLETGESQISTCVSKWSHEGRLFMRMEVYYTLSEPWVKRLMDGPVLIKRVTGNILKDSAYMNIGSWRGVCGEGFVSVNAVNRFDPIFEVADLDYCKVVLRECVSENQRLSDALGKKRKPRELEDIDNVMKATSVITSIRYENIELYQLLITSKANRRTKP